ncbi:MAG: penicillin-binding protein 2 [Patescibacteria group bacterium]|jgi:penicillin-binding protein 2
MKKDFRESITWGGKRARRKVSSRRWELLDQVEFLSGSRSTLGISIFLAFILFVTFLFYLAKSFELQIVKGEESALLADINRTKTYSIPAERGVIYDRNGKVLVRNMPSFSLIMDARTCYGSEVAYQSCVDTINNISNIISLEGDRIFRDLSEKKPNISLSDNMTKEEVLVLEPSLVGYSNVEVMTYPTRDYVYKEAFAHVLGYVGSGDTLYPSVEGKTGIEDFYNEYLSGVFGRRIVQTDSAGNKVSDTSIQDSIPGDDVVLNLDLDLQLLAFSLLKEKVDSGEALAGAIVAQDPKTGGVLVLASYPSFDPQALVSGISPEEFGKLQSNPRFPFFNRVISAAYPPGSVFKPVPASAALMEGTVDENTTIVDNGYIQIGSYIFRNWKLDGHGVVNIRKALQVSNDTYFYTIGGGHGDVKGLGIEKLSEWARKFGFAQKTNIDLNGEVTGYFPDGTQRQWYLGDTFITTIGQGDTLVTPIQINNMISFFANGGFLMRPQVARKVAGQDVDNDVINQGFVSDLAYSAVREGLRMAVQPGGTGYPFFDFKVEVAGKTGTAEYITPEGKDSTHAWFAVFGPYDDAKISLTVFLEGGDTAGSDDAAPIARKLFDKFFESYPEELP